MTYSGAACLEQQQMKSVFIISA